MRKMHLKLLHETHIKGSLRPHIKIANLNCMEIQNLGLLMLGLAGKNTKNFENTRIKPYGVIGLRMVINGLLYIEETFFC
jgi:hypothetical protein